MIIIIAILHFYRTTLKVLDRLCEKILEAGANVVFYIADADLVDYQTAAVSYFLQIADFIGLPVIMWTAHMTGLPSVSQRVCRTEG